MKKRIVEQNFAMIWLSILGTSLFLTTLSFIGQAPLYFDFAKTLVGVLIGLIGGKI